MSTRQSTKLASLLLIAIATLMFGCSQAANTETAASNSADGLDRTVLPIAEPKRQTYKELDARNAKAPARWEVKAPQGAPNIVVVLIDDIGFGASSTFGGPINMPNLEKIAANGLKYNRFHTTALCSPTRVALLTGYNHHSNNAGSIMETSTAFPGNSGVRPQSITPMAEVLRQNGFSTAAFGKYHETPPWEISAAGPYDRWPTHSGFEKFYGFIGGETNQYAPLIYDGTAQVELPEDPKYHFTTDMTNQAVSWMKFQKSLSPDKPFFIYFAPGAAHAPHHVPAEWRDKYKGKFDQGWDKVRAETLERQKKLGIVPASTTLGPKPKDIKDWDSLSADEKKLFSRQMETYAGFAEHTDNEIGRLYSAIEEVGQKDNTLFIYIVGDNGASAEGQMNGTFNEMSFFNGAPETVEGMLKHYDEWGSESTYPHYAAGWAVAMDSPFSYTKQVASDFGGVRNGMVISWPNGIKGAQGEVRSQFGHVIDIAPTVFEAAKVPAPRMVNGIQQDPIEGKSLVYSFNDPNAKETHTVQYFEMFGNRSIYSDGWLARTIHRPAWQPKPTQSLQEDPWELYNTNEDFSLSNNLAANNASKLKELQDLFMAEAEKYHVLPIDDRLLERTNAELVGRPTVMEGRNTMTLGPGMKGMGVDIFIATPGTSYTMTADVEVGADGNGVIVCQGGRFGGFSFHINKGKPTFTYNYLGLEKFVVASSQSLTPGKHTIVYDFKSDGGLGKGGMGTISVNGTKVGEGRIGRTQPGIFSVDDLADVGTDDGTPVTDYGGSPKFKGTLNKVTIEVK